MRHQVKATVSQAMRVTVNKSRFAVTGYLYMHVSLYMIFIC